MFIVDFASNVDVSLGKAAETVKLSGFFDLAYLADAESINVHVAFLPCVIVDF